MKFHEENSPTISLLMKSYMDLDNFPVISHIIKEVSDFKAFIELYLWSGAQCLIGHTKAQQFWFYMHDDVILAMWYKLLRTTQNWSPPEGFLFGMLMKRVRKCYQMGSPNFANQYP